ncbi:hypothetical protein UFOVP462_29 [uncultured Caudovirales phage]|uniref:Uncharacterized protein n=1 Tax=uncultured Caudovirales phage TaxID=2100421 RepID=A0A6J5MG75_9CAUD|nr:hypothetical protein UFOVP462_29 [uncultured Caudovirales phage]
MVKYLKKLYEKLFKSEEDIEHQKKVEFYNRIDNKTTKTGSDIKTKSTSNQTI